MTWLNNVWYQAGWIDELDQAGRLARRILDRPVLIFRSEDGAFHAIEDRCPHRFAPLSAGTIEQGLAVCGYHGLGFDGSGQCRRNPHAPITSAMKVAAWPVVARHQALWIWPGDPALADPALVPDLGFIDAVPERARITMAMPTRADYRLLIDNIMDLSHADYLHPTTIGGINTTARKSSRTEGDKVVATWDAPDCEPPPAFRAQVAPAERADIWTEVTWQAPGVLVLGVAATAAGVARTAADEAWTLHNMTPEAPGRTHYFVCATRPFLQDDVAFSAMLREALRQAFEDEDKPMLERQQASIGDGDIEAMGPLLLPIDAAAVRVRRMLAARIAAEAGG